MSELYASMLMLGVTLSLGSVIVGAAVGSFGQAEGGAALGASVQESASGTQLSLAYAAVAPLASCPGYQGTKEGTALTVSLFDYGTLPFTPAQFMVNSTVYGGSYPPLAPGAMGQFVVDLGSCSHTGGLTVVATDVAGDEVQVEP
ncbi:MAG: hypothetical protein JRN08_02860 [Nitrososphaerota archaeon]|nr:hypothetical protein [Nitrososphaerota archaeon]